MALPNRRLKNGASASISPTLRQHNIRTSIRHQRGGKQRDATVRAVNIGLWGGYIVYDSLLFSTNAPDRNRRVGGARLQYPSTTWAVDRGDSPFAPATVTPAVEAITAFRQRTRRLRPRRSTGRRLPFATQYAKGFDWR